MQQHTLRPRALRTTFGGRCCPPPGPYHAALGDWAAKAGYPLELREMALAHAVGDAVVKAYNRPQAEPYKVREPMMRAWGKFCTGKQ